MKVCHTKLVQCQIEWFVLHETMNLVGLFHFWWHYSYNSIWAR